MKQLTVPVCIIILFTGPECVVLDDLSV